MTISNLPTSLATALAIIATTLRAQDISFVFGVVGDRLWIESDFHEDFPEVSWYELTVEPTEVMRDFNL